MSQIQNRRILVVDDNGSIHDDFRKILGPQANTSELEADEAMLFGDTTTTPVSEAFEIEVAFQGEEGLTKVVAARAAGRPYALAFIDGRMPPGWDGVETTERVFAADPEVQVVLCTAFADYSTQEILRRLGKSHRLLVLKKPFDVVEASLLAMSLTRKWTLSREVGEHVEHLQHDLQESSREVVGTQDVAVYALAKLADSRDPETGEHLSRMREFSQILARHLARREAYAKVINDRFLEDFYRSTPLHDIGKVGIPDNILLKPGRLTPEEFDEMKKHTTIGAETLKRAGANNYGRFLNMAVEIASYHHEKFNGKGYPHGLRGEDIPLSARIVAVADVFDALTSRRCYKDAMDPVEARELIRGEAGEHFDPRIVEVFLECFDELLAAKAMIDGQHLSVV